MVKTAIPGNISSNILDHLSQFFILRELPTKYTIMSHDWQNFNKQLFIEDFEKTDWNRILKLNQNNVNLTFKNYLNSVTSLINFHAPVKYLSKKEKKNQKKPWITKGIQYSFHKKNRLFKK